MFFKKSGCFEFVLVINVNGNKVYNSLLLDYRTLLLKKRTTI